MLQSALSNFLNCDCRMAVSASGPQAVTPPHRFDSAAAGYLEARKDIQCSTWFASTQESTQIKFSIKNFGTPGVRCEFVKCEATAEAYCRNYDEDCPEKRKVEVFLNNNNKDYCIPGGMQLEIIVITHPMFNFHFKTKKFASGNEAAAVSDNANQTYLCKKSAERLKTLYKEEYIGSNNLTAYLKCMLQQQERQLKRFYLEHTVKIRKGEFDFNYTFFSNHVYPCQEPADISLYVSYDEINKH